VIATARWAAAIVALGAFVFSIGCANRAVRDQLAPWQLRGAIVEVGRDRLRVRHKSGQVVDLLLDGRTDVVRGERPVSREALGRGTRVRVDVEPLPGGEHLARTVHVYGGSPLKS
jgi:hypothetical protein